VHARSSCSSPHGGWCAVVFSSTAKSSAHTPSLTCIDVNLACVVSLCLPCVFANRYKWFVSAMVGIHMCLAFFEAVRLEKREGIRPTLYAITGVVLACYVLDTCLYWYVFYLTCTWTSVLLTPRTMTLIQVCVHWGPARLQRKRHHAGCITQPAHCPACWGCSVVVHGAWDCELFRFDGSGCLEASRCVRCAPALS